MPGSTWRSIRKGKGGAVNEEFFRLLDEGRRRYKAEEYPEAEDALRGSLAFTRTYADVHNMLGVIYHTQGRLVDARAAFEEALKVNPKYTEAALHLTITLNDLGEHERAREIYREVAELTKADERELDPMVRGKIANMHAEIADAYASYGRTDEALMEFGHALDLCPEFIDLRARMAAVLRDRGEMDRAIEELTRVKLERPSYLEARVQLGLTLYKSGRLNEAIGEWESVLAANPEHERTRMYLNLVTQDEASSPGDPDGEAAGAEDSEPDPPETAEAPETE